MPATEVKLQGIVSRMVNKAAKVDSAGIQEKPAMLEVVIQAEMTDMLRTKLSDISRLQNGKTVNIILQEAAPMLFKDEETRPRAKAEVNQ